MKKKLERLWIRLRRAVRQNPVEVLLTVLFCLLGCYYNYIYSPVIKQVIPYFPVFFLTTCLLNRLTVGKKGRWLYVVSSGFFIPFFWLELEPPSVTYWVTLAIVQLLYLIGSRERDNERFVRFGLSYLGAVLAAWLLASITWALAQSVYYSIRYIFEIGDEYWSDFTRYSSTISYLGFMPLLFLMFSEKEQGGEYGGNKVFQVLLNYVLSPVLLVYAVILYMYVIKIAVLWSLPKGAVAYIVVSFVSAAFLLKGCQPLLSRRWYDWFYNHTSLAVLPALVLYWIGASYRIHEYGFTVARVYLVVIGIILTGTALLFFFRRTGRYLYAAWLAVAALSVVTYIPGIKAEDIERISQMKRNNGQPNPLGRTGITYVDIEHSAAVDSRGYTSVYALRTYQQGNGMIATYTSDTLYISDKDYGVIWAENMDSLFMRRLSEAGLTLSDTIPKDLYPSLLEIDLDSMKIVLDQISVRKDTTYHIQYIIPAFYLKR